MRHSGIIRLDHVMGPVFDYFGFPEVVLWKREHMFITRQMNGWLFWRLKAIEIGSSLFGEDLGTVTPSIRNRLEKAGLLSYRVLLFEKSSELAYPRPRAISGSSLNSRHKPMICLPCVVFGWVETLS